MRSCSCKFAFGSIVIFPFYQSNAVQTGPQPDRLQSCARMSATRCASNCRCRAPAHCRGAAPLASSTHRSQPGSRWLNTRRQSVACLVACGFIVHPPTAPMPATRRALPAPQRRRTAHRLFYPNGAAVPVVSPLRGLPAPQRHRVWLRLRCPCPEVYARHSHLSTSISNFLTYPLIYHPQRCKCHNTRHKRPDSQYIRWRNAENPTETPADSGMMTRWLLI